MFLAILALVQVMHVCNPNMFYSNEAVENAINEKLQVLEKTKASTQKLKINDIKFVAASNGMADAWIIYEFVDSEANR